MVPVVGLDLRCGAGQVAALTCPRHVIHSRSRSSPFISFTKQGLPHRGGPCLVPVVGLEPTRCRHQRILSPSRLPFHHTGVALTSIYQEAENSKRKRIMPCRRAETDGRAALQAARRTVRTADARQRERGRSDPSRRAPRGTAAGRRARPSRRERRQG